MLIIGLTGGSGSGKSKIATLLKDYGMFIIDADNIAHEIIKMEKPAYCEIIEIFGKNILDDKCEIDRKKLGKIVFSDKNKLELLTKCTHKHIIIEIEKLINKNRNNSSIKAIVIDAALLIESGIYKIVDKVWVVYADIDTRIQRIMLRDSINYEQAKNRINSQMSWQELSSYADIIINNVNSFDETINYIKSLLP